MPRKNGFAKTTVLGLLCVTTALSAPIQGVAQSQASVPAIEALLETAAELTIEERINLINIVEPEAGFDCSNPDGDTCARRVAMKISAIIDGDAEDLKTRKQKLAFRALSAWADANAKEIRQAEKATKERREERAAAAAADAESQPAEVEREKVTDETSRSSDEDKAESGDDSKRLLTALGILGAAALAGKMLDNGDEVVEQQGDRLVVRRDGELVVRKDENEILRRPGSEVETRRFDDGSTRTVVTKPNGNRIVVIRDANGETIKRTRILEDGREVVLFDNTEQDVAPVDESKLANRRSKTVDYTGTDVEALRRALREEDSSIDRRYSLRQIRSNERVRSLVPQIDLDGINFATGSAAIRPREAEDLAALGNTIRRFIDERPDEVFLIEGHTDAVGSEIYNLALSDRRAESVALAEYFDVPPENLVVQGYGESFLKVNTQDAERQNRRAVVRRITPLLTASR